jgi:hypothetical protein
MPGDLPPLARLHDLVLSHILTVFMSSSLNSALLEATELTVR